jgi:co-chaperonin GroES (HSP10)
MRVVPRNNNVLLKRVEAENVSNSGLLMPGRKNTDMMEVVAVGEQVLDLAPVTLVLTKEDAGQGISLEGETFVMVEDVDIIAIFSEQ